MALADTARLIASLELQDKFSSTASKFDRTVAGMDQRTARLGQIGEHIGQGIRSTAQNLGRLAIVGGGIIAANVAAGVRSLNELENVETQTKAVLTSTRGQAGLTADEIRKLAQEYENLNATIDDKVIQSGENLLLTFTNIDKRAFQPALKAALDMNQAMGGGEEGLQSTVIRLGKALQDPITGFTALRRVGVNLTKQQQDQIKKLVDQNKLYDAQQIILKELSKEFGGSFAKAGDTATAKFAKVRDAVEDAQQALATAFLPVLTRVADKLSTFLADPQVIARIKDFGSGIADAFDKAVEFGSKIPWGTIGSSLQIAGAGAKAVLDAFVGLPSWIQTAVLTGWGLNKLTGGALGNLAGDAIKLAFPKLDIFSRGASPANPLFVSQVGPSVSGPGGALGGGKGFWAGLGATFGLAAAAIIGERVIDDIQTGFNNARTVREGGVPTPGTVTPATIGPTVELNRDLFRAIGQLGINLSAGGDLATEIDKIPESLREDVVTAILNNPTQQKALHLTEQQLKFLDGLDGHVEQTNSKVDAANRYAATLNTLVTGQKQKLSDISTITARTRDHMAAMLGKEDAVARNTAAVASKDFSPRVAVDVHSNTSVSVNDVVRAVNSYSYAVKTYGAKIGNVGTSA